MPDGAARVVVHTTRLYETRIATRLPFRFGAATVRHFSLLHLAAEVEDAAGRRAIGYAADNLMPKWFDKDPAKTPAQNAADLLASARIAAAVYGAGNRPGPLFALWLEAYPECQARAAAAGLNRLVGAFGSALFERAIIDAIGRIQGATLSAMLASGLLGIRPGLVHAGTTDAHLAAWAAAPWPESQFVRHTVGLLDPLLPGPGDSDDGDPRALADYIRAQGLRYFKLKLGGNVEQDLDRLAAIAAVLDPLPDYRVTLDGNEQYPALEPLARLLAGLGKRLAASLLFIEQPLPRAMALDAAATQGLAALGRQVPVIIDESDDAPDAFPRALALGYAGVSTKNCKGVVKSVLNRALVEARRAEGVPAFMSAEDLTNLPIVPLQQDLAVVAALGIGHVERNGHHYVRGLDHCPLRDCRLALDRHADLYRPRGDGAALRIADGRLAVGSLAVPGLGVAFEPDLGALTPL